LLQLVHRCYQSIENPTEGSAIVITLWIIAVQNQCHKNISSPQKILVKGTVTWLCEQFALLLSSNSSQSHVM